MTDDQNKLVERVSQGDAEALKELLGSCGGDVWSEVNRDIGKAWKSLIDADDVMQVTYMEAFLQMERVTARDVAGFKAWLRRMAMNNLRDAIKELQRKKRPNPAMRVRSPTDGDSYVSLIEYLGSAGTSPSRHVARNEAAKAIESILERLPPDYGKVVQLYDLDGMEIKDVASEMNRSPGAVHMLRARAHDRLRSMLGSETDFFTHTS